MSHKRIKMREAATDTGTADLHFSYIQYLRYVVPATTFTTFQLEEEQPSPHERSGDQK